jgi:hypothetical protein
LKGEKMKNPMEPMIRHWISEEEKRLREEAAHAEGREGVPVSCDVVHRWGEVDKDPS